MANENQNPPDEEFRRQRIAHLARLVLESDRELRELTGGQLKALNQDIRVALANKAEAGTREVPSESKGGIPSSDSLAPVINALPAHIAVLDPRGNIVAVNKAWRHFATANVLDNPEYCVGENYLRVCEEPRGRVSEESLAIAAGIRRVLTGEASDFSLEYPCHSPGEKRWFRMMVAPLADVGRSGAVVMHINVTERRLAEEALQERERETRRLLSELTVETRRLRDSQTVAKVGSWETDLRTFEVTWSEETFRIFETDPAAFHPTHEAFLQRVHPDDRQVVAEAFAGSMGHPGAFSIEHRLLLAGGKLKHVEERWRTFNDDSGKPSRALGTCHDITDQKAVQIAIETSEERFRKLYENAPDPIYVRDISGNFMDCNPAMERALGYSRGELVGRNFLELDFLKPEDVPRVREALARNAKGFGSGPNEYVLRRKDGEKIVMEMRGFPITIGDQRVILGVGREITARKLLEARITRINGLYRVLSRVNELIVKTADPGALFSSVCQTCVEKDLFRLAAVMKIDFKTGRVVPEAYAPAEDSYFSDLSIEVSNPEFNRGTIGTAIRLGRHAVCNDTLGDPRMQAWREALAGHSLRSTASFPIRRGGEVIGVLVLFSESADYFQDEEIHLLCSVAEDISFALDSLEKQRELQMRQTLLSNAERIGRMGAWNLDLIQRRLLWSEATCEIFGIRPGEFQETFERFISLIHPPDVPVFKAALDRITRENPYIEAEYRIRRPDGQLRWVYERGHVEFDDAGRQTRRLGMVMDLAEAKQAREERDRLFNLSPDLLCVGSFDGRLLQVNPAWTEALGWSAQELTGRPSDELVHPDDRASALQDRELFKSGVRTRDTEIRLRCKDGSYRWFSWNAHPFPESQQVFGVGRDMTARRRSEEQLRLLETCVSRLNDIVLITEAEPIDDWGPRIVYVNDAFVKRTGYSREEALGKTPRILQGPKTQRAALNRIRAALKAWLPSREELLNYSKSGEEFWIELDITPVADSSGWYTHWVAIQRDITDRKRATEALLESQRKYRDLVEASQDLIWSTDEHGTITFMNLASRRILGREPEEMVGRKLPEFMPAGGPEEDLAVLTARASSDSESSAEVMRVCRKEGAEVVLSAKSRLIQGREGMILGYTWTGRDISAQTIAEQELRRAEAQYRSIFDNALEGIFQSTPEGRYVTVNPAFARIHGYDSPGEMIESCRDIGTNVYVNRADREAFVRWISAHGEIRNFEHKTRRKDGSQIWVSLSARVVLDPAGRPVLYEGSIVDITERKRHLEQLGVLNLAVEQSPASVVITTPSGDIEYVNSRFTEMTGYDDYEVIGKNLRILKAGDDPSVDFLTLWSTILAGKVWRGEFHNRKKSGETYWEMASVAPVTDDGGRISHFVAVKEDITERRNTQAELLHGSASLAGIVETQQKIASSTMSIPELFDYVTHQAGKITRANGAVIVSIEGETIVYRSGSGVFEGKQGMRLDRENTLSRAAVNSNWTLCSEDTEGDARVSEEFCREFDVRSMIAAPFRAGSEMVGALKVVSGSPRAFSNRDISNLQILSETLGSAVQRILAAEALEESVQEFTTLAETMPQIVWTTRPDGWTTYFNQNWTIYTGIPTEEGLGYGWVKPIHPEDQQRVSAAWQEATSKVASYSLESRLRRADGEYRWWLIRGEPLRNEQGEVVKWFGTCTDIDSLKRAELQIIQTNRALKLLSDCGEALIHAEDEVSLLRKVCQTAVDVGGYRMAWVGYAQPGLSRAILPMACAGVEEGYLSEVAVTWRDEDRAGQGPAGRAISENRATFSCDMEADPTSYWLEAARKRGFKGMHCLPLKSADGAFGVLALYSEQVMNPGSDEIELLKKLADDLSFGIQTLRSRSEPQKLQEAVLGIARGVSSDVGEAFFSSLNRHTIQALRADAGFIAVVDSDDSPAARTISAMLPGGGMDNFEFVIEETPCAAIAHGQACLIEQDATARYPRDPLLTRYGIKAYAGTPLLDSNGTVIGFIVVLFQKPIEGGEFINSALRIFAARAASELERQKTDRKIREQAALLDAAHDAIFVKDLEDRIVYWNKGAERVYGWTSEEILGRKAATVLYANATEVENARQILMRDGSWEGELNKLTKDGRNISVRAGWTLLRDSDGHPKSILAINSDLTEKKKLEAQFLRAQRMESIGTLAGGIAHDLNNILAPIMLSVDLLREGARTESERALLGSLMSSARRGADLVGQVLTFARGVQGRRVAVDLAHLLQELAQVMRETFPKNIEIEFRPRHPVWPVTGDPTQIHQVLLNLCVNARDAMPRGGRLTLGLENVEIDANSAAMSPGLQPGPYVLINVQDDGVGIPPEQRDRIFEPFFTTKEVGKGTGLGLSTSLAIVKSHGGFINLYSEVGNGSQFKVYFPADAVREDPEVSSDDSPRLPRGQGETILVVEDEEVIREVAQAILEGLGYRVLVAANGAEAIGVYARHQSTIAVVLTDMAMPVMDGEALMVALKALNPRVRVIGSSGFAVNGLPPKARSAGIQHFIAKPYTAESLLKTIRTVLESPET
jgi:PAS domain S-box-containing protein